MSVKLLIFTDDPLTNSHGISHGRQIESTWCYIFTYTTTFVLYGRSNPTLLIGDGAPLVRTSHEDELLPNVSQNVNGIPICGIPNRKLCSG